MEDNTACGPVLPAETAPPIPSTSVRLFPEGTKVIDISKEVGITLQTGEETKTLGGGYCVMWMLYLALEVVKLDTIWERGIPYATRRDAYEGLYRRTRAYFPPGNVSAMADSVRKQVDTFNGKGRSMQARVTKKSDGTVTSSQGNPFTTSTVMAPTVEPVKKILRGEAKGSKDGDVELGRGRFYAPSNSTHGYDMHVKSILDRPQMVRPKLRELVEKGDKPVIFNLVTRESKVGAMSHALLAIYVPAAFTEGVPELHVLTTYPILPEEIENIRTIPVPVKKGGRHTRKSKSVRRKRTLKGKGKNR